MSHVSVKAIKWVYTNDYNICFEVASRRLKTLLPLIHEERTACRARHLIMQGPFNHETKLSCHSSTSFVVAML